MKLHILLYIDPGTGSIIIQALIAALVGGAVAVRLFWQRILIFFGFRKSGDSSPAENEGDSEN